MVAPIDDAIASATPVITVGTRLSTASLMLSVAASSMPSSPRTDSSWVSSSSPSRMIPTTTIQTNPIDASTIDTTTRGLTDRIAPRGGRRGHHRSLRCPEPLSYSAGVAMSRPWTVSAQMTATDRTIIRMLHQGWYGSHAKLTMALTAATHVPMIRPYM